jgi:hypothetical protein
MRNIDRAFLAGAATLATLDGSRSAPVKARWAVAERPLRGGRSTGLTINKCWLMYYP